MIGRLVKVYISCTASVCLYENGWFQGKILYFNTQICEYYILVTDGTTDCVTAEDVDGIDLILL